MKSKLVIVDKRCNKEIIEKLASFSEDILLFATNGITYDSISCHPDIFIYKDSLGLVIAPNTPQYIINKLKETKININVGIEHIGKDLKETCYYNCLSTEYFFFHKRGFTAKEIMERNIEKQKIWLPQSYTRCSLINITDSAFITSDEGIYKELINNKLNTFIFSPFEIKIETHKYGFLGGTCGTYDNKIFFLGNPLKHKGGNLLCKFIEQQGLEIISLSNDFLYDGGGLFFI